jgi:hypothetical protein
MKSLIGVLIFLNLISVSAQDTYTGIVLDSTFNTPLSYVNIGIINKGEGTVSNTKGDFELQLAERYFKDSIRISMIGYKAQTYLVKDFKQKIKNEPRIFLAEKLESLDEVVISNKKLKKRILGNRTKSKMITDGFDWDKLGSEAGIVIKIKKSPTYIKSFQTHIALSGHDELKFRLNFYTVKNGLPFKNITKENIILTSNIKEGTLSVDLSEYNIVMEEDFFVSLEWIENFGDGNLQFSMGLWGSPAIYRYTSQDRWEKIPIAGPGFNVNVEY